MGFSDNHEHGNNGREKRWLTPPEIVDALGMFDLDPCGAPGHVLAGETYLPENGQDGLSLPWFGRVWLNPPYGDEAAPFINRLAEHGDGILLYFVRTDTKLFHDAIFGKADAALFLRGRLRFWDKDLVPSSSNANAASVLVAFGELNAQILKSCNIPGKFVRF